MACEEPEGILCECCREDIYDSRNAEGERAFVVVLTGEALTEALAAYVVRDANLPSCRFESHVKIARKHDGVVEAVVEIVWWPNEPEGVAYGS